jgi:hypothetical protein
MVPVVVMPAVMPPKSSFKAVDPSNRVIGNSLINARGAPPPRAAAARLADSLLAAAAGAESSRRLGSAPHGDRFDRRMHAV